MEKLETIEVINLELNEIQKAVTIMDGLRRSFANLEAEGINDPFPKEEKERLTSSIKEIREKLTDVVNYSWDCLNVHDAVTDIDESLSELPMKIINSKKYEK